MRIVFICLMLNLFSLLPIEGADAKASVALTETLVSQKRLACESLKD